MQDTEHTIGPQDVCSPRFSASSFPSLHVLCVLVPSSFHNNMPFPSSLFSLSVSGFFFLVLLFSPIQIIPLFCSLRQLSSYALRSFSKSLSGISWCVSYHSGFLLCKPQKLTLTDLSRKTTYWKDVGYLPASLGKLENKGRKQARL